MNIAPFESMDNLLEQLRVNARGEAGESGHPVEEHPSWIAAAVIGAQLSLLREIRRSLDQKTYLSPDLYQEFCSATNPESTGDKG